MFRFGDPGGRGYNTIGTSQVNLLAWWNGSGFSANNFSLITSGGRNGGNCIQLSNSPNSAITKAFDNQPTWGIAFAVKPTAFPGTTGVIFRWFDAGTSQTELYIDSAGFLRVYRNIGATLLGIASSPLVTNTWQHIEWKTKIDGSVGTVDVRVNGVSVISLTGQNTRQSANNYANLVYFGTGSTNLGGVWSFDDIIIYDGQLTDPAGNPDIHDFIGDCGLAWIQPSGAGTTTQFTPGAGSNFAQVNEATPDGDTSYVENLTVGNIDTYAMADLPGTAAVVKSLALVHYAKKTDVGARGMVATLRTGGANFNFANEIALPSSYVYSFSNWGSNPSGTPAAWTPTTVNSLETGQKVSS